ncbi:proton/nucleoside cotransporter [Ceratobasidium sp. AG-Ba]|nr:proton/nucleoside cotransporter [Ceratobasidium sp. AG-Ba]
MADSKPVAVNTQPDVQPTSFQGLTSPYPSADEKAIRERSVESSSLDDKRAHATEAQVHEAHVLHDDDEAERRKEKRRALYQRLRPFILVGWILLILAWWICSTILPATRHRWIVQTFWAWSFIALLAFRFIPNSVITKPVSAVWQPLVSKPFFSLSYRIRLAMGWLALLGIVFGSAFGFPLPEGTGYGDRAISVFGLFVFTCGFYLSSRHRSQVPWPTVIVGLFMQQAVALFVLKTDAGFKIFLWIATLASDFLEQAVPAAGFFFDTETTEKHWFFVNTLGTIIFFIAFVQMLYYIGVMQWMIKKFAWFFFKTMNVSGAEAVVAAASPWIGQGESACLVRPFVDLMTDSEIHLTMTSGFSTIAGSVFAAYVNLGVPAQNLVTSSVMSIPASIAISKMRIPELDEPVTRGQVVIDQGAEDKHGRPANALHAFSKGAIFGLIVAGQILCNVLTVLALVYTINGLLTWVGKGFGIHHLTLELIFGYCFYPITFLLGVPRAELLRVARLLATKLVANEFVAYLALKNEHAANPFSPRAYTIISYGLCGFANLGSLGIQIGVLGALAPSRGKVIARVAPSAMICGFLATLQTAGIAGMLV